MSRKWGAVSALYLVALFLFVGFLRSDAPFTLATGIALLLGVGVPVVVASRMLLNQGETQRRMQKQGELRSRTVEAEVLRIAKAHQGKLTIVEIVSELAITPEEAKAAVDSLVRQQIGDIEVTESGVLVYVFHDIKHLQEKQAARNILE
jgi:predicted DNA-binding transcriptional regulator